MPILAHRLAPQASIYLEQCQTQTVELASPARPVATHAQARISVSPVLALSLRSLHLETQSVAWLRVLKAQATDLLTHASTVLIAATNVRQRAGARLAIATLSRLLVPI